MPIIHQRGEGLKCEALYCRTKCPASKAFCDHHWRMLDVKLQSELVMMFTQQIQAHGKFAPHPKWKETLQRAIQWLAVTEMRMESGKPITGGGYRG